MNRISPAEEIDAVGDGYGVVAERIRRPKKFEGMRVCRKTTWLSSPAVRVFFDGAVLSQRVQLRGMYTRDACCRYNRYRWSLGDNMPRGDCFAGRRQRRLQRHQADQASASKLLSPDTRLRYIPPRLSLCVIIQYAASPFHCRLKNTTIAKIGIGFCLGLCSSRHQKCFHLLG